MHRRFGPGIEITGRITPEYAQILTPEAVAFAAKLQRAFGGRRNELLARRAARQAEFDAGKLPDFLPETRAIREANWTLRAGSRRHPRPPRRDHRPGRPQDDHQRAQLAARTCSWRTSRTPTRRAGTTTSQGHVNLRDAIRRRIDFIVARRQGLQARTRRPRCCSCARAAGTCRRSTCSIDGAADLRRHLRLRAVLLPQREGAARARQRPVLLPAEAREPPRGAAVERHLRDGAGRARRCRAASIKATVLIETILAAFEMDEILYELREHSAGLNAGRWDYIFSCIKKFRSNRDFCLADRALVTMTTHFLKSYAELLDQDLPPPQHPRDGRHGRADPGEERRAGERRGVREGEGRQGARGDATATTAPGSRTRRSSASRRRRSTG